MALQLDTASAIEYQRRFETAGAKFLMSEKVVEVVLDPSKKAVSINLESGKTLPCDFVIVAAGVRPNCGFAEGADITIEKGIVVDNHMKTTAPHIYAAGDVTGLSGIWPNAMKQGKVAAENILGEVSTYTDGYANKNTANFYGLVTLSIGLIAPNPEDGCDIYLREDRSIYQKIVVKDHKIKGVILQGDISNSGFWQYLIKNQIDISGVQKQVFDLSFADFYGIEKNGEYHYIA
ncbi:MAG: FAD-dependent oxidoreductase [Eubacterium sp.]